MKTITEIFAEINTEVNKTLDLLNSQNEKIITIQMTDYRDQIEIEFVSSNKNENSVSRKSTVSIRRNS